MLNICKLLLPRFTIIAHCDASDHTTYCSIINKYNKEYNSCNTNRLSLNNNIFHPNENDLLNHTTKINKEQVNEDIAENSANYMINNGNNNISKSLNHEVPVNTIPVKDNTFLGRKTQGNHNEIENNNHNEINQNLNNTNKIISNNDNQDQFPGSIIKDEEKINETFYNKSITKLLPEEIKVKTKNLLCRTTKRKHSKNEVDNNLKIRINKIDQDHIIKSEKKIRNEEELMETLHNLFDKDYTKYDDIRKSIHKDCDNLFVYFYNSIHNPSVKVTTKNWRQNSDAKSFIINCRKKYYAIRKELIDKNTSNCKYRQRKRYTNVITSEEELKDAINTLCINNNYENIRNKSHAINNDFNNLFISFYKNSKNPSIKLNTKNWKYNQEAKNFIESLQTKYKPNINAVLILHDIKPTFFKKKTDLNNMKSTEVLEHEINQLFSKDYSVYRSINKAIRDDFTILFIHFYNGYKNPNTKVTTKTWRNDTNAKEFIEQLQKQYQSNINALLQKYNIKPNYGKRKNHNTYIINDEVALKEEINKLFTKDYSKHSNKSSSIYHDFDMIFLSFYNNSKKPKVKVNTENWRADKKAADFINQLKKGYQEEMTKLISKWQDNSKYNINNKTGNNINNEIAEAQ